jgi:hypothetical protein
MLPWLGCFGAANLYEKTLPKKVFQGFLGLV